MLMIKTFYETIKLDYMNRLVYILHAIHFRIRFNLVSSRLWTRIQLF